MIRQLVSNSNMKTPHAPISVPCGSSELIDDIEIELIDANEFLASGTSGNILLIGAKGVSMTDYRISPDSTLVVDRDGDTHSGDPLLISIDNEFTVKALERQPPKLYLVGNSDVPRREVKEHENANIVGVVVMILSKPQRDK